MYYFYVSLLLQIHTAHVNGRIHATISAKTTQNSNYQQQNNNHITNDNTCTSNILRLDEFEWTLKSDDHVYHDIHVTVPGDIISDLYKAGIISYPFYDNNFLNEQHVWMGGVRGKIEEGATDGATDGATTGISHLTTLLNDLCYNDTQKDETANDKYIHKKINGNVNRNYFIPNLKARKRTWIYESKFSLASLLTNNHNHDTNKISRYVLVIESIKMGASIHINGFHIANVTNQFRRYTFPIPDHVWSLKQDTILLHQQDMMMHENEHSISISFIPDINSNGRFMACSGGWDWAPYTQNAETSCLSRRVFTFGIVKPIYILQIVEEEPYVTYVIPKLFYLGNETSKSYLHGKMDDYEENGDFILQVDVHLTNFSPTSEYIRPETMSNGKVIFSAPFFKADKLVGLQNATVQGNNEVVVTLSTVIHRKNIQLWWPHNSSAGQPTLYTLKVAYFNQGKGKMKWVEKQIGFRTIRLVTSNGSEMNEEGNKFHGMYFRINGKLINVKGANIVPMSQLEGFYDDNAHRILVESAKAANMNMLRVWGGGTVLPNSFYEACDKNGILIYQDLMFVEEQFHSPIQTKDTEEEIKHIVRSLISHPSIVIWNGCNECERDHRKISSDIFSNFVIRIVASEDPTRPIWPNSPSKSAWRTGVYTYSGLPNGNDFSYWTLESENDIEAHGPYLHGSSFEKISNVNGHPSNIPFSTTIPIKVNKTNQIGPQFVNQFVSEFGASVFSSFESMSSTISKQYWGLHSGSDHDNCTIVFENYNDCSGKNVMSQRNYPCDNLIRGYFGSSVDLHQVGPKAFQHQLYLCMIAQSLWMKGQIEMKRNQNIFGLLIWQLNENWPTGGWGLVEYGSHAGEIGQVVGGRWKPLMYLLKRSLFRDVIATCGEGGLCYCRNDGVPFNGTVIMERLDLVSNLVVQSTKRNVTMEIGDIEYFTANMERFKNCCNAILLWVIDDKGNELMGTNVSLYAPPKDLVLAQNTRVMITSIVIVDGTVEITLISNKVALYVVLSCLVDGQFEDNAVLLLPKAEKIIKFIPTANPVDITLFKSSLRIDHLAKHLSKTKFMMNDGYGFDENEGRN